MLGSYLDNLHIIDEDLQYQMYCQLIYTLLSIAIFYSIPDFLPCEDIEPELVSGL